jgi:hypothetical protein
MAKRRNSDQLDLLSWQRGEVIERFEQERIQTSSMRARIARSISAALQDCEWNRKEVARRMSAWLGEKVTENMLNAYASEARSEHSISHLRMLALVVVTGDPRLLQVGAELIDHSVISDRYLPWVEVGQLADKKDDIDRAFDSARRQAKKAVRS